MADAIHSAKHDPVYADGRRQDGALDGVCGQRKRAYVPREACRGDFGRGGICLIRGTSEGGWAHTNHDRKGKRDGARLLL